MTLVVSFIGSPCSGKSTLSSLLYGMLKLRGVSAEHVPEYAKQLVWSGDLEVLNNQWYVSHKQYEMIRGLEGKVDVIVVDGSLLNCLYYNQCNEDNTSNVEKTKDCILDWTNRSHNLFFFVERGEFEYQQAGRIENELQSAQVEKYLRLVMQQYQFPFVTCRSNLDDLQRVLSLVLERLNVHGQGKVKNVVRTSRGFQQDAHGLGELSRTTLAGAKGDLGDKVVDRECYSHGTQATPACLYEEDTSVSATDH